MITTRAIVWAATTTVYLVVEEISEKPLSSYLQPATPHPPAVAMFVGDVEGLTGASVVLFVEGHGKTTAQQDISDEVISDRIGNEGYVWCCNYQSIVSTSQLAVCGGLPIFIHEGLFHEVGRQGRR